MSGDFMLIDMLIIGENFEIKNIVSRIKENYKISKSGFTDFILGIKIEREDNKIYISQEILIDILLNKHNINNKIKLKTPCVGYSNNENNETVDKIRFKGTIRSLIYFARCICPIITIAVNFETNKSENQTLAEFKKKKKKKIKKKKK